MGNIFSEEESNENIIETGKTSSIETNIINPDDFIYPIVQEVPKTNPFDTIGFSSKDPKEWIIPRNNVLNHINTKVLENGILPIGTKLYHGSLDPSLEFTKNRITFFGIDVVIALWYLLELRSNKTKNGFVYEFITTKPIKIYVIDKIIDNPKDVKKCKTETIACIHPQLAFHGTNVYVDPPYDLSIELTMNMQLYKDSIKLNKKYTVDKNILIKNKKKSFDEFNPIYSIIDIEYI